MANEVRIKLTEEQKAKIKEGTGKDLSEIRVSAVGSNPAPAKNIATAKYVASPRFVATAKNVASPKN
ncbi:MAG TPA: hypothetical protein VLH41_06940, partial [Thermoanaerobaculia bacterium]|nr:hypothetical protein [Thermoanaerobaculia bacterium]